MKLRTLDEYVPSFSSTKPSDDFTSNWRHTWAKPYSQEIVVQRENVSLVRRGEHKCCGTCWKRVYVQKSLHGERNLSFKKHSKINSVCFENNWERLQTIQNEYETHLQLAEASYSEKRAGKEVSNTINSTTALAT